MQNFFFPNFVPVVFSYPEALKQTYDKEAYATLVHLAAEESMIATNLLFSRILVQHEYLHMHL